MQVSPTTTIQVDYSQTELQQSHVPRELSRWQRIQNFFNRTPFPNMSHPNRIATLVTIGIAAGSITISAPLITGFGLLLAGNETQKKIGLGILITGIPPSKRLS